MQTGMPSPAREDQSEAPRYKRRRDGCQTCRSRRVKCVGEKPTCGHCQRLVLKCHWPEPVDAVVEGSRSKRRRQARASPSSPSTARLPDAHESAKAVYPTSVPQEPLQLLSQLASQPAHFDSSSVWSHYQGIEHVSPTSLQTHPTFPTNRQDPNLQSHVRDQSGVNHPHENGGTLTRPKANEVSIFNSNAVTTNSMFPGPGDLGGYTFDCSGSITQPVSTDQPLPSFDESFNFDLLFGLDQPVLLPSAPPPAGERNGSGVFDIPNFDSWTLDSGTQNDQSLLGKRLCSPVTLEASDQPITTYFLQTVSSAAITRYHNTSNYYVSLFSCSLFCPALYHGMLAWSAAHMAAGMDSSEPRGQELQAYAKKQHALCGDYLFPNLENVDFDTQAELEALYCALMVCGQYKAVSCAPASAVRRTVNAIDGLHQRRGFVGSTSPLIQRMVSILAQYDVRSSLFGVNEPKFTLRLGSRVFERSPAISGFLGTVSVLHMHYLDAKASDLERQLRDARSNQDVNAVRRLTRLGDELFERIVGLEHLLDPDRLGDFGHFDWSTVVNTLDYAGTKGALSQDVRHEIILAVHFHGVVLNICRILNYPVPTRSVDRVIGLTLDLTVRHPEGVHGILSIPMFFAAVECRDSVKVESALKWFTLPHAAVFGTLGKSKELLLEVRQVQSEGARVDIGMIMMRPKYNFLM